MNKLFHIVCLLTAVVFAGCSHQKHITFTSDSWRFDTCSSTIVNADASLRFSLGNGLHDSTSPLISSREALDSINGLTDYLSAILSATCLNDSRIMLYAPLQNIIFAELPTNDQAENPNAVTSDLDGERPYTAWLWDDDVAISNPRPNDEMRTSSFADRRGRRLIVVDKFTYDTMPIARISIIQSETKRTRKIGLPANNWLMPCNVTDMRNIIPVANWVDGIRDVSLANYHLGQQAKQLRVNRQLQAELAEIIRTDQEPRNRIMEAWRNHPDDSVLHSSIAAEVLRNDSINLAKVCRILDHDGFVGKDKVGEECIAFWLVIQHSPLEYQQKYIPLFRAAAINGDLPKEAIALMEDRIAVWSGRPQIYGSQGSVNDKGIFIPAEILDPENVDARRAEMGLQPLSEYVKSMSEQ